MDEIRVPQTLDAPPLALVFNASQIFAFIGFTVVGVIIGSPFICGALGLFLGSFINKFSDKKPDGYLRHRSYFLGLPIMSGRGTPHGLDREFRP